MTMLRRVLIFVLILSMVLGCVGCADDTEQTDTGLLEVKGQYLVNEGTTEYKIVIPENASNLLLIAASEFNKFLSEATGVTMPVVTDSEIDGEGKFISMGETTLLKDTDITYSYEELGRDGYKIVTKNDDLYLIGGHDYGSMYAAYELLEILVDYDFYAADCYTLTKGLTQIPLYDFDLTDLPDFPIRIASDGVTDSDTKTLYRLRQRPLTENYVTINNYWSHNSFQYVIDSPDVNSNWYNAAQTQLCYTAHGIEEEYQKMLNASFLKLKESLIQIPDKDSVAFTMQDNSDSCDCDSCLAIVEKYGAISASFILFLNDLNKLVRDWFETEEGKPYARDLKLVFFAYAGYETPPTTYNAETGKYEANAGLEIDEGVYCMLAPIAMDYYKPITDTSNQEYYNNLKAWSDIANGHLYLWYYSTNFLNYLAPYDSFDSVVENYRAAVDCGVYYLFDQRQTDERGVVTGWSTLKNYVCSKLAWDVELNQEELIDKFFNGYFGPAASEMRGIFDQYRLLTNYNKEYNELGGRSSIYLSLTDEKFWPKDILEQWLEAYDRAEAAIAPLQENDPQLYAAYLEHINREKISTLYLFVECYSYNTRAELIDAYKAEFKELADGFGIVQYRESVAISNLYDKWGLN